MSDIHLQLHPKLRKQPSSMDHDGTIPLKDISNAFLPDIQKQEIEDSIRGLQEDKRLINDEIKGILLVLDDLYAQLRAKNSRIESLKGMVSPLKLFPNELLSMIFEEYALGLEQPPWLLGHICSRWRKVALTTPRAWSHIVIRLRESSPTYSNFDKEKVHFHRATKVPISCRLILKRPNVSSYYFFQEFNRYTNRLHHLSLDSVDSFLQLLTQPHVNLSSLETLNLTFSPQTEKAIPAVTHAGEIPEYKVITLFENTPNLRRVGIDTDFYDRWVNPNILPLQLPWIQLTHLLLSPYLKIEYNLLSAVLRLCKNLAQCRFPMPGEAADLTQPTLIELQHLGALEITHGYITEIEYPGLFLQRLVLPSLKRLILTSPGGKAVLWPMNDIANLISRSGCDIEVFHARSSLGNHPALALLNKMPSVTELLVQGIDILPAILGRMAHENFLFNLSYIECRTYAGFESTPYEIVEALGENGFMEAPSDAGVPLSVHILTLGGTPIEPLLDDLRRNWLEVSSKQIGKLYETECELHNL